MPGVEQGYCGACMYWKRLEPEELVEMFDPPKDESLNSGKCMFVSVKSREHITDGPIPEVRSPEGELITTVPVTLLTSEDSTCMIKTIGNLWAYEVPFDPDV